MTPRSREAIERWRKFAEEVYSHSDTRVFDWIDAIERRMERGRAEYGDTSFTKPLPALLEEIEQELYDVGGWEYIADQHPMAYATRERLRQVALFAFFLWMQVAELKKEVAGGMA